jgi:hypothetical protein
LPPDITRLLFRIDDLWLYLIEHNVLAINALASHPVYGTQPAGPAGRRKKQDHSQNTIPWRLPYREASVGAGYQPGIVSKNGIAVLRPLRRFYSPEMV